VARLAGTELRTRQLIDGLPGGSHRGLRRGSGVEFAEHKEYSPGDDPRHLDWRAYARSDRLVLKRFEQEVHVAVTLVIDASASMALSLPAGGDKFASIRLMAAALALLVARQGDAVGLVVAGRPNLQVLHGGGQHHAAQLIQALEQCVPSGPSALEHLGEAVRHPLPRRGMVIAFSDLLGPPTHLLAPLVQWRRAGLEVVVLHCLHPRELDLDLPSPLTIRCSEGRPSRTVDTRLLQRSYGEMLAAHRAEIRDIALGAGIALLEIDTSEDPAQVVRRLIGVLTAREFARF
jgi:uncharacterized protein (DUF58 family)